jgi:hypothetical protein
MTETGERFMNQQHRFWARARDKGVDAHDWVAEADNFIDAALRFAESVQASGGDIPILVTDCETGKERCFVIHLATGEVESC